MKTEKRTTIPMNIQFFAEPAADPENQNQDPETDKPEDQNQEPESDESGKAPTLEEVMAEAATERAAKEKNKIALDKALREVAELKASLRKKNECPGAGRRGKTGAG